MNEIIERAALALATKLHVDAVRWNLREINQSDQFENHMKMWPVKVEEGHRDLVRLVIGEMREPTDAMRESGRIAIKEFRDARGKEAMDSELAEVAWRAMITLPSSTPTIPE
ncbi:hypothetical protein AB8A05_04270 [Tardiphaga sp. 538_B7_N1_4]|uniref:hypothetical protein n=1 Tax=Tardiphaga sp. 538_B7_N1_4 TaxID=3240778 RepID=UPI003F23AA67